MYQRRRQPRIHTHTVARARGDGGGVAQRAPDTRDVRPPTCSPSTCRRNACASPRGCSTACARANRSARCSATGSSAGCTSAKLAEFISVLPRGRAAGRKQAAGGAGNDLPVEAIAANNVVDGLALQRKWKAAGSLTTLSPRCPRSPTPRTRQRAHALEHELIVLDEAVDTVSDALMAESVHQAVQATRRVRPARSSHCQRRGPPPELDVVRTPRTGIALTHRVVVLFDGRPPARRWADASIAHRAARGAVAQRLGGTLLSDPARCVVWSRARSRHGDGSASCPQRAAALAARLRLRAARGQDRAVGDRGAAPLRRGASSRRLPDSPLRVEPDAPPLAGGRRQLRGVRRGRAHGARAGHRRCADRCQRSRPARSEPTGRHRPRGARRGAPTPAAAGAARRGRRARCLAGHSRHATSTRCATILEHCAPLRHRRGAGIAPAADARDALTRQVARFPAADVARRTTHALELNAAAPTMTTAPDSHAPAARAVRQSFVVLPRSRRQRGRARQGRWRQAPRSRTTMRSPP